MAGKKRKAAGDALETRPTRRQSGRVGRAKLNYEESDIEEPQSNGEFNEDVAASESAEATESDDEYESDLKKKGWTKKKGKDGKWQMVIDVPQEKDPGGIPYEDERIHPNTMEFLNDLKKNNKREWLKFHDAPYRSVTNISKSCNSRLMHAHLAFRQAEKDFQAFVTMLSTRVSEKDPTIPELPIKDIIFRIYRDMRFSSDPTPYKPYFSATWSRTGRKGPYAHYYIHIQPNGESFFG